MAATDSYRLAEKRIELDSEAAEAKEVIIPSRCINELARVVAAVSPDVVKLTIKDNQALFAFADTEIVSRLIDGKYPDYQKIIPEKMVTTAGLDTEEFKSTLRTVSIFAREASNVATLHFGPENSIKLLAVASSLGDSNTSVAAEIDGQETEAKFNVKYLLDGVSVIGDEKLEFGLSGQYQPGMLKGIKSKDFRYIIMPLKTD
jgi:DNA polymerase-3 subunit beta